MNKKNSVEIELQKQRRTIFHKFLAKISISKYTAAQQSMIKKYTTMRPQRFNKLLKPAQIIDYISLGRNSSITQWKMPDYISVIWLASKIVESNKKINYQIFEFSDQQYRQMDKIMGWKTGESQSMLNCLKLKPYSTKWKKYEFVQLVKIYKQESAKKYKVNWKQIADCLAKINKFPLAMYRCQYQCQLKWKQASMAGNKIILNQNVSRRLKRFTRKIAAMGVKDRQSSLLIGQNSMQYSNQDIYPSMSTIQASQIRETAGSHQAQQDKAQAHHFAVLKLEEQVQDLKNILSRFKRIYREQYEEVSMSQRRLHIYENEQVMQEQNSKHKGRYSLQIESEEEQESDSLIFYA